MKLEMKFNIVIHMDINLEMVTGRGNSNEKEHENEHGKTNMVKILQIIIGITIEQNVDPKST